MEIAMMVILTLALTAAVVSFAVMGFRRTRHTRRLARQAGDAGLHFAPDDPFDLAERYRYFTLMSCGHTPRATNVAYGQIDSRVTRAFEFCYEVGHGTRRTTCRYGVVVVELKSAGQDVLLWNHADAEQAPLEARLAHGRVGCWAFRGSEELAQRLGLAAETLADDGLSLQVHGPLLLLCLPSRHPKGKDYFTWLPAAARLADVASSAHT